MQWDEDGIQIWFFPRSNIPSDISAGAPLSTKWGQPMARWPADKCNPTQFFKDHSVIFDTTLWCVHSYCSVQRFCNPVLSCVVVTGLEACGPLPVFLARSRVAQPELDSRHARHMFVRRGLPFSKHVSFLVAGILPSLTNYLILSDWEVNYVRIYQAKN